MGREAPGATKFRQANTVSRTLRSHKVRAQSSRPARRELPTTRTISSDATGGGAFRHVEDSGAERSAVTNRDLNDINRLLAEYYVNFDRGEHEAWADLFAPDGEFLAFGRSFSGHDRLTRLAQSAPTGVHVAGAPLIEVDGEHATVQ
ncbi:MAG: hypothetical protein E6G14_17325, partial [Actinobacteria bacterium]